MRLSQVWEVEVRFGQSEASRVKSHISGSSFHINRGDENNWYIALQDLGLCFESVSLLIHLGDQWPGGLACLQNGDNLFHVHVLADHSTSLVDHPGNTRSVCWHERTADSHSFWFSSHNPPTRPSAREGVHNSFSRCLWYHQKSGGFQARR